MAPVLNIINANKNFDGTIAPDDFSLEVPKNSITGIIGPNGAGKATLFNVITGFLTPDSGKIIYGGRDLNGLSPYRITRLGMVREFGGTVLIVEQKVREVLEVCHHIYSIKLGKTAYPGRPEILKTDKQKPKELFL